MKKLLPPILTMFSLAGYSQDAPKLVDDTILYSGYKFYKGLVIKTGYGSGENSNFLFIDRFDHKAMGFVKCPAEYKKSAGVIQSVSFVKNVARFTFKSTVDPLPMLVDIEGAVDKKELLLN